MVEKLQIALIAFAAVLGAILFIVIIKRCCFRKSTRGNFDVPNPDRSQNLHGGIARLHQVSPHQQDQFDHPGGRKLPINNYDGPFHLGVSKKPAFNWADHPSLVTDAVENGWSRFAFTSFVTSAPPPSASMKSARAFLAGCGDSGNVPSVEIGWEVSEGSADFMQKIRLNPNSRKIGAAVSVIRAALPLPGPNLGNSSFPQEAYFEITVLSSNGDADGGDPLSARKWKSERDKIKLIGGDDFDARNSPDSVSRVASSHSQKVTKIVGKHDGKMKIDPVLISVGFTGGGPLMSKPPGSFPGSIGFNSTGSVYLDGIKLVFDSENDEWAASDKVIGCGYNPGQKKVFFTVDSQLVHEIHCKSEEFSSPLYPTISSNAETVVLVNLGQSPFKFVSANSQRTPNPCFVGPLGNSPSLGYEDSRELFSMGRIDGQWQLQRNATRSNNIRSGEYDQESEGDLFEIVLESNGRSPYGANAMQHQYSSSSM